ncbi:hypothetical protein BDF19DRAFT_447798 [Syncephalis fuscata]|nr:hypothetical protein BDF19DRAFT_447798 [Syncephalis fuscata]
MITLRFPALSAAFALIVLSTIHAIDALPSLSNEIHTKTSFLGYAKNSDSPFFKRGIEIIEGSSSKRSVSYAKGIREGNDVVVTCGNEEAHRKYNSLIAYKYLVTRSLALDDWRINFKQNIAGPIDHFSVDEYHCYVTPSRCDRTFKDFAFDLFKLKDKESKPIAESVLNQAASGLRYLRKLGIVYYMHGEGICINSGIKVLIRGFENAFATETGFFNSLVGINMREPIKENIKAQFSVYYHLIYPNQQVPATYQQIEEELGTCFESDSLIFPDNAQSSSTNQQMPPSYESLQNRP